MDKKKPAKPATLYVVVVASDVRILTEADINCIHDELFKRLWVHVTSEQRNVPLYESYTKISPFGISFESANEDAYDWLKETVKSSPLPNRKTAVLLFDDVRIKMEVKVTGYPKHCSNEDIFKVLARTNGNLYDTHRWNHVERESDFTSGSVIIEVPLADIPKLNERQFKLYFLFGTVQMDFRRESKIVTQALIYSEASQSSQDTREAY